MGDDGMMSMPANTCGTMTYCGWSDYKLKIVFEHWNVTSQGMFVLSWFAVVLMVIAHSALKYYIERLDATGDCFSPKKSAEGVAMDSNLLIDGKLDQRECFSYKFLAYRGFLAACSYGISLLLMLIAMTFQPWLLVALMIGYGIGEACFYSRTRVIRKINGSAKGACIDCH